MNRVERLSISAYAENRCDNTKARQRTNFSILIEHDAGSFPINYTKSIMDEWRANMMRVDGGYSAKPEVKFKQTFCKTTKDVGI